ncbi:MAG: adenosylhomocysteinase [Fusobacterium sp.]|nr:adenosylhomocysteinase [Fusobacterium sp.]
MTIAEMKYEVKDLNLADQGKNQIEWAFKDMPVLKLIQERFIKEQPFKGLKLSACVHVTKETAALCVVMKAGGADAILVASNPLSTQDDVAAALVKHYGIPTFAVAGETPEQYRAHIEEAIKHNPDIIIDDGCDIVSDLHSKHLDMCSKIIGSTEETTTGITRLQALEKEGKLQFPAVGVNTSMTKHLYDNRYGTGQSAMDGIFRGANILIAGKTVVISGYGWCGRGCALRAKALGANVIVCEVDPLKALEAAMEGYRVMPIAKAALEGDIFLTVTGDKHVVDVHHLLTMKDGAFVANAGHFDWEVNVNGLKEHTTEIKQIRPNLEEYKLTNGKSIYVFAQGRLVNLIAAEGHPASVMDMSFANQALGIEFLVKNKGKLENKLYTLPEEVDMNIAELKLKSMGIEIDTLTEEQQKYLNSWDVI